MLVVVGVLFFLVFFDLDKNELVGVEVFIELLVILLIIIFNVVIGVW